MRKTRLGFHGLLLVLAGLLGLAAQSGVGQAAPTADPANLSQFVAPDFFAAAVIHPRPALSAMKSAGVSDKDLAVMAKSVGVLDVFQPDKIRALVVFFDPTPSVRKDVAISVGFVLQFRQVTDSEDIIERGIPNARHVTFRGKSYVTTDAAGFETGVPLAYYVAGPRTLVGGPEPMVRKMLTPSSAPRPLLDQLKRADTDSDIAVVLATGPLMKSPLGASIKALDENSSDASSPSKVLGDMESAQLVWNFDHEPTLKVTLAGADATAAARLKDSLETGKAAIAVLMKSLSQDLPNGAPTELGRLELKIKEMADQAETSRDGNEAVLTANLPDGANVFRAAFRPPLAVPLGVRIGHFPTFLDTFRFVFDSETTGCFPSFQTVFTTVFSGNWAISDHVWDKTRVFRPAVLRAKRDFGTIWHDLSRFSVFSWSSGYAWPEVIAIVPEGRKPAARGASPRDTIFFAPLRGLQIHL